MALHYEVFNSFQDKVKEVPKDLPEVVNDFDIEEEEIAIENRYLFHALAIL